MNSTELAKLNITLDDPVKRSILVMLRAATSDGEQAVSLDLSLWPEIQKELMLQAVLPLVSSVKLIPSMGAEEKQVLATATAINVRRFHEVMGAQRRALLLLSTHGITAVVLKGAAAGQYYSKPSLRMYGDMDILVAPADYRKAFDVFCAEGYRNHGPYDAPYDRHIGFTTPEGQTLELHRRFSSSASREQNALLDGWLYEDLKKAVVTNVQGYAVPVLPPLANGLVLLAHMNQHLCDGLGLRHIVDWLLYVRANLTDEFWQGQFREWAAAIGMDYLAKVVARMGQKYLGLGSEFTWCRDAEEKLADDLMLYILRHGNFGRRIKQDDLGCSVAVLRQMVNPAKAFRFLTHAGSVHMEEAGFKPRKSLAWLFELRHLATKVIRSKQKLEIVQGIRYGAMERELLQKLRETTL